MSITAFNIYVWQTLDNVRGVLCGLGTTTCVVGAFGTLFLVMCIGTNGSPHDMSAASLRYCHSWLRRAVAGVVLGVVCLVVRAFTPSSDTWAMMQIIPMIADSKVIKEDIPDIYNAAISRLKQAIATEAE